MYYVSLQPPWAPCVLSTLYVLGLVSVLVTSCFILYVIFNFASTVRFCLAMFPGVSTLPFWVYIVHFSLCFQSCLPSQCANVQPSVSAFSHVVPVQQIIVCAFCFLLPFISIKSLMFMYISVLHPASGSTICYHTAIHMLYISM